MRELQRDDVPHELWPLYDQLQLEIERVRTVAHHMHTARRMSLISAGAGACAVLSMVVSMVLRAL